MATEIVEYSPTEQALADLRSRFTGVVFDVATTKGMAEAKTARAELRKYRVALESKRVEIKAPALERCRLIDTEAKRITAELAAMEEPIDQTIKREERRKELERAEREQAEREATDVRNRKFDEIKALPLRAVDASADAIVALIEEAQGREFADFEPEFRDAAKFALGLSVLSLKAALDKRRDEDAKSEQIRKDLAELELLRAEQSRVREESDRLAAAERDRAAAEARRLEDLARAEREATERAAREARDIEQARIDAERAERRRIEDAEREAAAKKLREDQAAVAAAAKLARESEIANATLITAAVEALKFLRHEGYAEHIVTQKLDAAIRREPPDQQKAA
jgi:colicin import membrane protein